MNRKSDTQAVILLSGGLDSATCLAIAKSGGFELSAISFRYGQRHSVELNAACKVAKSIGVKRHIVVDVGIGEFGCSALTSCIDVPKNENVTQIGGEIPVTYVPARNTVFLAIALAWAESLGIGDIFIGVNSLDCSGYPDCRGEYIAAFQVMANLATKSAVEGRIPVKIHAPLLNSTKSEIIRCGTELGVDYGETSSCYDPSPLGEACGYCDSCLLRLDGFKKNGLIDPAKYAAR